MQGKSCLGEIDLLGPTDVLYFVVTSWDNFFLVKILLTWNILDVIVLFGVKNKMHLPLSFP